MTNSSIFTAQTDTTWLRFPNVPRTFAGWLVSSRHAISLRLTISAPPESRCPWRGVIARSAATSTSNTTESNGSKHETSHACPSQCKRFYAERGRDPAIMELVSPPDENSGHQRRCNNSKHTGCLKSISSSKRGRTAEKTEEIALPRREQKAKNPAKTETTENVMAIRKNANMNREV